MKLEKWTGKRKINFKLKSDGGACMFKSLNLNILKNKKSTIISSEESLKDVTPINWSEDVLSGNKKVIVDNK